MKNETKAAAPQKKSNEVNVSNVNGLNTSVIAVKATPQTSDDDRMDLRQQSPLLFNARTVKDQLANGSNANNMFILS
jgi:hypothetical protein